MTVKFECIEPFSVEKYDDDGFHIENEYENIEKGEIFECDTESKDRVAGSWKDTLQLTNDKHWIEITKEHVREYFVQLDN